MNSSTGRTLNAVVFCLAAVLLIENIVLERQNRQLKANPILPSALAVRRDRPLQSIGGVGLDGQFHSVNLPVSSTDHLLVFTFAPTCPECQLQEPLAITVSNEAKKQGWRILWISSGGIEETRAYCDAYHIPSAEILVNPPYQTYLRLGMEAVPQLVAVGDKGEIEQVWTGRLTEETASTVSKYLATHSNNRA